jgi:hypothetical protein
VAVIISLSLTWEKSTWFPRFRQGTVKKPLSPPVAFPKRMDHIDLTEKKDKRKGYLIFEVPVRYISFFSLQTAVALDSITDRGRMIS